MSLEFDLLETTRREAARRRLRGVRLARMSDAAITALAWATVCGLFAYIIFGFTT
jgi:hypothetical protein